MTIGNCHLYVLDNATYASNPDDDICPYGALQDGATLDIQARKVAQIIIDPQKSHHNQLARDPILRISVLCFFLSNRNLTT